MRKSILAMFVVMIACFAVACGGNKSNTANGGGGTNEPAKCGSTDGGSSVDAFALYKKKGRKWMHKSTTKMEGMDPMVSYMSYEITDVNDKEATQLMIMLDKDKKPMAGMEKGTETKIPLVAPKVEAPKCGAKAPEMKKEKAKCEAGEFECYLTEMNDTKTWTSVEYPGLLVKMEGKQTTMELISFDK